MATNPNNPIHQQAEQVGSQHKDTNPRNPSILSSEGAIGKQFQPDAGGSLGKAADSIGGPFAKDGVIGKQFDASGGGIAGTVEKAVDGPRNPASETGLGGKEPLGDIKKSVK